MAARLLAGFVTEQNPTATSNGRKETMWNDGKEKKASGSPAFGREKEENPDNKEADLCKCWPWLVDDCYAKYIIYIENMRSSHNAPTSRSLGHGIEWMAQEAATKRPTSRSGPRSIDSKYGRLLL